MFVSVLLVGLFASAVLGAPGYENRVVGGIPATEGQIPYIISLKNNGGHSCGGSIIDPTHILTAAHCVYGSENRPEIFQVQYGVLDSKSKKNLVQVKSIKIHEDFFYGGNFPNDIAVLTLESNIPLGGNVQATKLPTAGPVVPGTSITSRLSGWGYTANGGVQQYLLTAEFPLFSDSTCSRYTSNMYDPRYHVCAGDLDGSHKQCSGDSGGPLYAAGVQHGVVSWSFKPCTVQNRPGIFTRVASYLDWIEDTVATNN